MVSTVHVDLGENLAGIGSDENFAIPYWESKTQCEPAICSEELLSVTNQADGTRRANTLTTGRSLQQ